MQIEMNAVGQYTIYAGKRETAKTLEDKYADRLAIKMDPYAEISTNVSLVLDALMHKTEYYLTLGASNNLRSLDFTHYALYMHNGIMSICPVNQSGDTRLLPMRVNNEGDLELSQWSLNSGVHIKHLDKLFEEGFLAGYVKVL